MDTSRFVIRDQQMNLKRPWISRCNSYTTSSERL